MSTKKSTPWTIYLVVALVSAFIGFGAIYAMIASNPNSNGPNKVSVQKALNSNGETNGPPEASDGTKLNIGKMTAFVFKKQPKSLPDVKFNNAAGKELSLESFAGKVILLNLWATWCAPCRKEMPHLDELQAKLGSDKFEVVAVSIDRNSPTKSMKFLKDIKAKALNFYHDPSAELSFTLKTIGMPTTFLIDAEGQEIGRLVGPAEWHSNDAVRLIKAHLAKTGG